MTDTPEIPMYELTYEWPVVIILGSGERLNLSTLDNTDYRDAARKTKVLVEQHRSDDPPERIERAGAWVASVLPGLDSNSGPAAVRSGETLRGATPQRRIRGLSSSACPTRSVDRLRDLAWEWQAGDVVGAVDDVVGHSHLFVDVGLSEHDDALGLG